MSDEERDDSNRPELPTAGDLLRWAEKTQRTIGFILRQQAQFNADMQRLRETQENSERRWERIERMWERTEGSVRSLHAIAQIHEGEITTLAETQAEIGERVNALVNTVEQLISERRNGGRGEEKTE